MNNSLKCLWVICLYGVIFFVNLLLIQAFTSITLTKNPQYYDFDVTTEVRDSNVIISIIYLVLLVILSIKWRMDKATERRNAQNIEMRPLKE